MASAEQPLMPAQAVTIAIQAALLGRRFNLQWSPRFWRACTTLSVSNKLLHAMLSEALARIGTQKGSIRERLEFPNAGTEEIRFVTEVTTGDARVDQNAILDLVKFSTRQRKRTRRDGAPREARSLEVGQVRQFIVEELGEPTAREFDSHGIALSDAVDLITSWRSKQRSIVQRAIDGRVTAIARRKKNQNKRSRT